MNSITYIGINLIAFVIGQSLVTRGHWAGFLVWCMANVYGAVTCVATGIPETSSLFAIYFISNFCSLWSWLKKSAALHPVEQKPAKASPEALVRV